MKLLEIGPYPPPDSGWSVRIKFIKEACDNAGYDCRVLNLGRSRRIKNDKYIDVQNGIDYIKKLVRYRFKGYHFHIHMNAQAVKGPLLSLTALLVSLLTLKKAAITFHGGVQQLYFPRKSAGKMYGILYLNFLLSGLIVCNNEDIKLHIAAYGPFIKKDKVKPIPAFSVQYLQYKEVPLSQDIERYINSKKHLILCYIVLRNGFYIDTLIDALREIHDDTGVILTGIREVEDEKVQDMELELNKLRDNGRVLTIDNLDHDQFMTLLKRCDIYLRTPVSDGVASSVLEALSQNVPVVASENGKRPSGVVTYPADDSAALIDTIRDVLQNFDKYRSGITVPLIRDTVQDEINLLVKETDTYHAC